MPAKRVLVHADVRRENKLRGQQPRPATVLTLQVASNMSTAQFLKSWNEFSGQVAAALSTNASDGALARLISERVRGQGLSCLLVC